MSVQDASVTATARQRRRVWLSVAVLSTLALIGAFVSSLSFSAGNSGAHATERQRQSTSIPVRAGTATRGDLTLRAQYTGELDAEVAELASQVTGRLDAVQVDIGDVVKQGQVLARIDASMAARQLAEARAQTRAADAAQLRVRADLEAAQVELARGEELAASGLMSQQELDALRTRRRALDAEQQRAAAERQQAIARAGVLGQTVLETRILAPFAGAIAERFLDPGALTQPGTKIVRVVRSGPLRVRFRVPERDLARLQVGMPLEVTTQATPDRHFAATVTRLSAEVSRIDRAAVVQGVLGSEIHALRPGMYAEVAVTLGKLKQVVLVPSQALLERAPQGGKPARGVFVIEAGRARFQPVRVLGEAANTTAVDQLAPGARVITLGQDTLKDGRQVRAVERAAP